MSKSVFEEEYKKLNNAQKEAVDTIEGPVMVVAGPGTGKTQILALRIGNILKKTDVGSDGVLCLTFTNSAVRAMRERLQRYIGNEGNKVNIATFHKFSSQIIDEFYPVLGFDTTPKVMEDAESVSICDQILRENEWKHIRPRNDISRHFKELKSLVSLLKRERMSPEEFLEEIEKEISMLEKDPDSISSRGESKGKLKKEILNRIESLEKTKEIVDFYNLYEEEKRKENLLDYDDEIRYALEIMENSEEARAEIREKYQYILIDEHQDSSGAQSALLKAIWQGVEKPNIFAVGDDRQLIYAFGGAKISHFEEFKTMFGKAKVIFLTDNYRSTEKILDTADSLLESAFSDKKLKATLKENHQLRLVECEYPRDEIIACALSIKEKVKEKVTREENCVILVPKNRQVVSALRVLKDMGLKTASMQNLSLFETKEFQTLFRILKICANSMDVVPLADSILDPLSGIPLLSAHEYLYKRKTGEISLESILSEQNSLFEKGNEIKIWAEKLKNFVLLSTSKDVYGLIQTIGDEVLLKTAQSHGELLRRVEVVRSLLHLALSFSEKNKSSIADFISFIERLEKYEESIPLAVFEGEEGVKVMTLHGSKGLEFDFVWIAHMDEGSLMKGKKRNFRLPEKVAERIEEKDEQAAKRELYVAITRARKFCTLSYSRLSYNGREQELAKIISDLPSLDSFEKSSFKETEEKILKEDPKNYVVSNTEKIVSNKVQKMTEMVSKEYTAINVSVSMLNNFFECPWKWYFRNLLKLPEEKSESLEFGSLVHSAIDRILKSDKTPSEKEIEKMVSGNKEAFRLIAKWVKERLSEIEKERENEKSVSVHHKDFPYLNIYGKIDLIEKLKKDEVRVVDFKTGSPRRKSDIEKISEEGRMSDYMRQLAMYSFLLRESRKGKIKIEESVLEFLEYKDKKDEFYKTYVDEEKIKLLLKDIGDYDSLVKNGEWVERSCNYKSFGKNTECEYCKMAEIYKS